MNRLIKLHEEELDPVEAQGLDLDSDEVLESAVCGLTPETCESCQ